MNLFILSLIQREIAEYMMDKHVSKILLEAVQMLCSGKHILDPEDEETNARLYRVAHKNHPVTIWVRKSLANYMWTLDLVEELHKEWRYRYQHPDTKFHKSYLMAQILRANAPSPDKFEAEGLTPFALAKPVTQNFTWSCLKSGRAWCGRCSGTFFSKVKLRHPLKSH